LHFCILPRTRDGTRLVRGENGGHDRPGEREHTFRMGRRISTERINSHVCRVFFCGLTVDSDGAFAFVRYAEMDPPYKNTLSHRYKALNMLVGYLKHTTI